MSKTKASSPIFIILLIIIAIFCGMLINSRHSPVKQEATYTVDKSIYYFNAASKALTRFVSAQFNQHKDILTFNK